MPSHRSPGLPCPPGCRRCGAGQGRAAPGRAVPEPCSAPRRANPAQHSPPGLQHLPKPAPSCTGQQHTARRSMSAPQATLTPAQQEGSVPALPHQRCHNNFDYKHFSSPCNFRQILEFQSPTFFFVRMTMTSLYSIKFSHLISSQENTNK